MHIVGLTVLECINIFQTIKQPGSTLRASGSERESLTSRIFYQILAKTLISQIELHSGRRAAGEDFDTLWTDLGRFCDSSITSSLKKVMHIVGVSVLVHINMFKPLEHHGGAPCSSGPRRESWVW